MPADLYDGDEIPVGAGAEYLEPAEAPALYAQLDELASTARIPTPRLWRDPSLGVNAYATGTEVARSSVTVTAGLVGALESRELRSVLAHEVGHIALGHGPSRTQLAREAMFGVQAVAAGAVAASVLASFTDGWLDDLLAGFGGGLLTGMAADRAQRRVLELMRRTEFEADRFAADVGGSPAGLQAALLKLERSLAVGGEMAPWQRLLAVVEPADAYATHPPTSQRVAVLEPLRASEPEQGRTCAACRYRSAADATWCSRCGGELGRRDCGCGALLDIFDRFCVTCGEANSESLCRLCGRQLQADHHYCPGCGLRCT